MNVPSPALRSSASLPAFKLGLKNVDLSPFVHGRIYFVVCSNTFLHLNLCFPMNIHVG
jgi:hypothetical protein